MDATKKFFFSFNGINYFLFIRKLTITNRIRHFSIAFTSSVFTQRQSQYLVLDLSLPATVCVCVGGRGGCLLHVHTCETLYHFELKKISSMKIIFQLQVPLKKSPHVQIPWMLLLCSTVVPELFYFPLSVWVIVQALSFSSSCFLFRKYV